ncbi:MAG TPA: 2-succinyl-5-enolpyruvyl-6-hydroxy-3-cyclohexene-1-carboxylic-acid synthase, partial [Candidatus Synoicihabitans sp.]|nr:2-succinyl-5-enolpyruvyl-6-hydroxy-3-cyclohexene-1-carboxylic-acid synthase [Candidatus Synoicihabitans sp.]
SAAFFALGLARRTHRPVALLCTSGSAGANYFPAIIEAHESQVPLLVLTADRPPELRECASGQTIDQQKYFGDHVAWYHEVAVPEPRLELLRYLRQTARQAWRRACLGGPVHLNLPFRDPLPPVTDASVQELARTWDDAAFFAWPDEPTAPTGLQLHQRPTTARGVIVAGPAQPEDPAGYAARVLAFANQLGRPVLADALSPVRHYARTDAGVVSTYDTILRNAALARDLTPRHVICLESWPTSKVLRSWLEQSQAEMLLVSPVAGSRDALHGRTREVVAPVTALSALGRAVDDPSYLAQWLRAESTARQALDHELADTREMFEPKAAWLLARHLPAGATVCVASSMPVRDVEYVWPASDRAVRVAFSRGANGIDGTLSTALGVAHGGSPTVLLTGDLALLHDTNGLLSARRLRGSLTVVLINNQGGGIFEHLPVAQFDPPFEEFFATPQAVDFAALMSAYGVEHVLVNDWRQFESLMHQLPSNGVRVLELRTDRKRDAAMRKRLFAQVAASLR